MPKLLWNGCDGYDNVDDLSLARDSQLKEVNGVLSRCKGSEKWTAFDVNLLSAEEADKINALSDEESDNLEFVVYADQNGNLYKEL